MIKSTFSLGLLCFAATSLHGASLADYDAAIDGSGFVARTTEVSATFDTTNNVAFDFGAISGDATFEFIVRGDPAAGGQNGFLAVATGNAVNSLRYEQWDDTGQLGFTRGGVADNTFGAAAAASPTDDTHVAYRWTQGTGTMDLFVNGALADTIAGATFDMPSGPGFLGNNEGLTQGMLGTISRVTTYDSALSDSDISSHSTAWTGIPEPSSILLSSLATLILLRRRR